MIRVFPVLALAALAVSGCGGAAPKGAAESASRLLAAAVAGDRVAFEAEIDRPAVRDDVRRQIAEVARGKALEVEGGPSEFALDRMISPAAIRLVHARTGQPLAAAPSVAQVARLMRALDGGRACLKGRKGDCLLTFARDKRDWRLVGMKAMAVEIEVASLP
jgi:CTP:molybdopterin cytidylyltransferase MocA